ncbi:MAG: hypothetical protein J6Y03_00390 [Alphaproteobacteria bacterium]|nr:hypothetical protein [Alphaproteobacteria bacterium]
MKIQIDFFKRYREAQALLCLWLTFLFVICLVATGKVDFYEFFLPFISMSGVFYLVVSFLLISNLKRKLKKKHKKSTLEQMLENEIKLSQNPTQLICIYEKLKSYKENDFYYDILIEIVYALNKINAFPKEVKEWLNPVDDFSEETLSAVMEEFIAMRSNKLKDAIAVEAFCDGFISAKQALACTDCDKYPKTVALLLSDPEDYDNIRETVEKEKRKNK